MTEAETLAAFLPDTIPPLRAMAQHIGKGLEFLSDMDFWQEFREAWLQHDTLNEFQPEIRALVTKERVNQSRATAMTRAEEDWFMERIRRKKPLRLYRGACKQNVAGFSWTTDAKIAERFARLNPEPLLVIGKLHLKDVIMRIEERGEKEVIAFPEHIFEGKLRRL